MFTGSCINLTAGAQSYCNRNLGATISKDALGTAWSFVSSRWGETILRRILASLNMTSFAIDWEELTKEVYDEVVLSARKLMVPCAMVYIYCAPCVCLIQTALKFCQSNEFSPLLDVKVRPDVRLTSRCCAEEANFAGVESLLEEIKQAERDNRDSMFAGIDRMWLEQRNFEHEAELIPPYQEDVTNNAAKIFEMHRGERKCASIIILSDVEEQQVLSLMQTQPLPKTARMPREDEIFQAKWNKPKQWHWQYLGTYTNSRPTGGEGRNLEEAVAERIDVTSHTSGSGLDTKRKRSESSDDESDKDDEDAGTFAKLRR